MKLGEVKDRLMPMIEDAHWAEQTLDVDDSQFTRRAYVRNLFAMIEGCIWALKETVLRAPVQEGRTKRLLPGEYELLSDKSYELKSNGQVREQTKYLRLPENVRFTFAVLSKYFGTECNLGVGTSSWSDFLAAQEIRNRITHPKTTAEFSISDEEITTCRDVCSWFNNLILDFFNGLIATSKRNSGGEA